jgi:hypothetical protein
MQKPPWRRRRAARIIESLGTGVIGTHGQRGRARRRLGKQSNGVSQRRWAQHHVPANDVAGLVQHKTAHPAVQHTWRRKASKSGIKAVCPLVPARQIHFAPRRNWLVLVVLVICNKYVKLTKQPRVHWLKNSENSTPIGCTHGQNCQPDLQRLGLGLGTYYLHLPVRILRYLPP